MTLDTSVFPMLQITLEQIRGVVADLADIKWKVVRVGLNPDDFQRIRPIQYVAQGAWQMDGAVYHSDQRLPLGTVMYESQTDRGSAWTHLSINGVQ